MPPSLGNQAKVQNPFLEPVETEENKIQNQEPSANQDKNLNANQNDELFENLAYLSEINRETQYLQHVDAEEGPEKYKLEYVDS